MNEVLTRGATKRPTKEVNRARQRIVAYAGKVFFERGFRRVTVDELCAGMAMSKRTFYQHFHNRDELVTAVIAERFGEMAPKLLANLTSNKPINEILEEHFDLLGRQMFSKISTPMMVDVQTLMPEVWERIERFREAAVKMVVELVRRGQREGAIRADLDPSVLGKVLQAIMTNLASPSFLMAQGVSLEQLGRIMHTVLLYGILVEGHKEGN
jgi:AcrR family transcriptional regulator